MKRVFALLLLALLLCGCTAQAPEETTGTTMETQPAVEPTEPTGSYEPDSAMETATGGAVRMYTPDIPEAYALAMLGEDLVVFSGRENTTLTKLTGENLYVTASVTLGTWLDLSAPSVQVTEKGVSYYDSDARQLVLLGTGLKEISRVQLPEDIVGEPLLSADRKRVYYCLEHSVWERTLETGIDRMIKEISESFTTVGTLLVDGSVLQCGLTDGRQMFLSVAVGKTLWQGDNGIAVTGAGNNWYAVVPEGILQAYVFGTGEEKQMLLLDSFDATGVYLEAMNCLVGMTAGEEGTRLDCFDLETGMCISTLTVADNIQYLTADASNGEICVLTEQGSVYLWNVAALPAGNEAVYSTPRYRLDSPDEEGYARCAAYAEEIGQRHGVTILFGEAATAIQPRDYDLTGEYLVPVIMAELEKLDALLTVYPEGMLKAAVEGTTGGTLYICLVREVTGSAELGIPDPVGGTQFWDGSDSYVAMAVGRERGEWYHQMYHALETRLMSDSKACYDWEYLNPDGFDYDYNYILNLSREDEGWLEGENRYFIDTYSMSFPMEDRARVMEYAMMENCGDYFASDAIQAKLLALCQGIREAYGLKKSPDTFLWEQYLSESLAYTK